MRKQLKAEILALDAKLVVQRYEMVSSAHQRMARLRRIPPLWLVGGGFGAGFLLGRIQRGSAGPLWRMYLMGVRAWGLVNMVMPPQPLRYGPSL